MSGLRYGAVALVALVALLGASAPARGTAASTQGPRVAAATICQPMTLRQRTAQLVVTGIPSTRVTEETADLIQRSAGSVILFGRNIRNAEQLARLSRGLRRAAPYRILIAVDEEGGRVSRLGEKGIVEHLASARELGRTKTVEQMRRIGRRLGRQMAAVGMDWNFAPVLDVADTQRSTVIGDRSYSGDPDVVARKGRAFAQGLQAAGIMTTGKHFPGHGRTTVDSHDTLPTIDASRWRLNRRDIKPFAAALPDLSAVMTAHIRYTAIDRRWPASLSGPVARILRNDLGYAGLIITDALEMGAITDRWSIPFAAQRAVKAGADLVLIGDYTKTAKATTRIVRAVRDGRITRARIDRSARRVLTAKGVSPTRIDCLLA